MREIKCLTTNTVVRFEVVTRILDETFQFASQ